MVNQSDTYLAHDFRGHGSPWRDGIVLPARRNGLLLWTELPEQVVHCRGLVGPKLVRNAQVVLGPPLSYVIS